MAYRMNPAVPIRAQPDALDGVRAMRRDMEHLLSSQRCLHWAIELARCNRRQNRVGIHP
jgi:hypothetical protein